ARTPWRTAIDLPGAGQLQHLRTLIEAHDYLSRVPDISLVVEPLKGADRIEATRGDGFAFIYSATGRPFEIRLGKIAGGMVNATWFDPRSGKNQPIREFRNQGMRKFTPPSAGKGNDWVLVLESIP